MDRNHLYEHSSVKIIVSSALQVKIINIHVLTHHPGLVHQILHIKSARLFIIHVYVNHGTVVASISTINMGVLLLTICTQHFPISYEGAKMLVIKVVRHAYRSCYSTLQFILGWSGNFQIMFSCAWFPACPTCIGTTKIDTANQTSAPY